MQANKAYKDKNGAMHFEGYRFDEAPIANQMAYLFGPPKGEEEAKDILTAANSMPVDQRQLFIEKKVKEKASKVDTDFQAGLKGIFNGLSTSGKELSGEEAGKKMAIGLMRGLGLNVNEDNVQTHYSPGPPQCFQITWVNRPTENLKNEHSNINKLSECYADSLKPEAQNDFKASWSGHVKDANNGGPKIDKQQFEKDSAKSFAEFKQSAQKQYSRQATPPSLGDSGNKIKSPGMRPQ